MTFANSDVKMNFDIIDDGCCILDLDYLTRYGMETFDLNLIE